MKEMNNIWLLWLFLVIVSLSVLEYLGWHYYDIPGTLSAHVRAWSTLHPVVPYIYGGFTVLLAWHFWAHS